MAIKIEKQGSAGTLLFLAFLIAVGIAVYFYWNSAQATKIRFQAEAKVSALQRENANLSQEFARLRADTESQAKKIEDLLRELSEARSAQLVAEGELKRKDAEIVRMQEQYERRIDELQAEIERYADFREALQEALAPLRDAFLAPGAVPAGFTTVPNASPTTTASSPAESKPVSFAAESFDLTSGQVLSVNRDFGFVVTSLGTANGARPGSVVQIYRREQPLGMGRIEKVQENISAVSIVSEDVRERIQNGDRVVLVS